MDDSNCFAMLLTVVCIDLHIIQDHYLMIFCFSLENHKFGVWAGGSLPLFINSTNAIIATYP